MNEYLKDPDAMLPFGIDVRKWLDVGDSVVSASIEFEPGSTLFTNDDPPQVTENILFSIIEGGAEGERSTVRFGWTTANGYIDRRTVLIHVEKR